MLKKIPFIVVHKGNQNYLKSCISSLQRYHSTVLLGNEENKGLIEEWYDINSFNSEYYARFDKCYKHMSSNSEVFEKNCFYRYITMYEFAIKKGIDEFVHCDSDIILLDSCSLLLDELSMYGAAYFIPDDQNKFRMTASPHFCYWKVNVLKEFIEYFIAEYEKGAYMLEEKYKYHLREKIPGGICDMTLLYLFSRQRKDIFNIFNYHRFYLNFNVATTEDIGTKRKYIIFNHQYKKINKDLFYCKKNSVEQKVLCLHMQGRAKKFMKYAENKKFRTLFFLISLLNIIRSVKRLIS
ncbi:hypothetical protein OM310_16835 [Escherichia albertii]|nr:hypothetical protein [Escherichia albertii]